MRVYKIVSLFICAVLLLVGTGVMWGCSTLKQRFSKKGKVSIALSHQQGLTNQSRMVELHERELMRYFGNYAVLVLKDGFRFSADSGLVGNTALISIRSEGLSLERQSDSLNVERLQEDFVLDEAYLATAVLERSEVRERGGASWWWVMVFVPIGWLVYRFCVWWRL